MRTPHGTDKKERAHKYYLQNALKRCGFVVDGTRMIISAPYPDFDSIPQGPRWYVGQLIKRSFKVVYGHEVKTKKSKAAKQKITTDNQLTLL